jgi:excisionase family DNA binding protein
MYNTGNIWNKGVVHMDKLTIKQAAEALKCSHQTIRRRIAKGEIPAKKEATEFGEAWYIPTEFISAATSTVDVVPLSRSISMSEIEKTMAYAVGEAVESAFKKVVNEHTDILRDEIHQLRSELNSHYRRVDEQIRLAANPPKQEQKGFFSRLFASS